MDIVSVNNLTKIYKQGTDEVYAVDRAGFWHPQLNLHY